MFNPAILSDNFKKQISTKSVQTIVECRFPQTDDIVEILAVYPQASSTSAEVSSGRVNFGGRLVCTVVYVDDGGKFCRMQKGVEFSHYCDDDIFAPAQTALCTLKCEKVTVKRDGSSIVVSAVIGAYIRVYGNVERVYISNVDGAVCKTENVNLYSSVTFFGESEVEDDFEADGVADILAPSAQAFVLRAQCGSGEVNIEGEIQLNVLAMRGNSPVSLERVIPFKSVVACENAAAGENCFCSVEIKDINVTATVEEDRGKCRLSVVATLGFCGEFCDGNEVPAVIDAFCSENKVNVEFTEENFALCEGVKTYNERVFGVCATKSKTDYTCNFKATALPKVEYSYNAQSGMVEGAVCALLLYEQNGEDKSTEITLPFAFKLSGEQLDERIAALLKLSATAVSLRRKNEDECEAEAIIKIYATAINEKNCRYASKISLGESEQEVNSAISLRAGIVCGILQKNLKKLPKKFPLATPI